MSVREPPHRPTDAEIRAAKELGLPSRKDQIETTFVLCGKAFGQKKYDSALQILRGLVLVAPDDYRIYECFGVLYQVKGRFEDALACFEQALEIEPNALHARVNLGEVAWRRHKDAERARAYLTKVVEVAPEHEVAGRAKATLKMIDKALEKKVA